MPLRIDRETKSSIKYYYADCNNQLNIWIMAPMIIQKEQLVLPEEEFPVAINNKVRLTMMILNKNYQIFQINLLITKS